MFYQYETPRMGARRVGRLGALKRLPVALGTDTWFDRGGVFTGSATVLDDTAQTPVFSYSVNTNNMRALAFPQNRSDPELVGGSSRSIIIMPEWSAGRRDDLALAQRRRQALAAGVRNEDGRRRTSRRAARRAPSHARLGSRTGRGVDADEQHGQERYRTLLGPRQSTGPRRPGQHARGDAKRFTRATAHG